MTRTGQPMPAHIGRFKVEAVLGRGGMGEVHRAVDPTLRRTVAIKTVRPDISRPEHLERLYREAQACARLQHPNIVTVYEAGEFEGVVYMAMEYLQGASLSDELERGSLSPVEKVRTLVQVLQALQHAHDCGVIHRDVKPGNVYRLPDGTVKLVDFGLARVQNADSLTASGTIVGTPHFASPEQLRGEELDARTDVYSTGALAYKMFTGRLPFEGREDSIATVILRVLTQPPPPMNTPVSRALPEIERIVGRAMAKAPGERFRSAEEMRVALERFLASSGEALDRIEDAGEPTLALPTTAEARVIAPRALSRRTWWAVAATAAALTVGTWLAWPARPPSAPLSSAPLAAALPPPAAADGAPAPVAPREPGARPVPAAAKPAAPTPPAGPAHEAAAKALFGAEAAGALPASTGLKFRVVRKMPDGTEADVDAGTRFQSGDRVRFAFESNVDGYLYVVQQGSSGRWTVLFPNPRINGGRNVIRRLEPYTVPSDDWFLFDDTPGTEQVFVFLSREALTQLPGFDRPVTRTETLSASVVDELQHSVAPRDLVLEKERAESASGQVSQATYVVNKNELGKSVHASVTLTHGQ